MTSLFPLTAQLFSEDNFSPNNETGLHSYITDQDQNPDALKTWKGKIEGKDEETRARRINYRESRFGLTLNRYR